MNNTPASSAPGVEAIGAGAHDIPAPAILPNQFKGHEIRYFNKKPVYITTLPAGTLLFRGIKRLQSILDDLLGYVSNDHRSLRNKHNVFFYPFPVFDKLVDSFQSVVVYVLQHDLKIATLINPSPYTRGTRFLKNTFLESCDTTPMDPCFTDTFIHENPDVVGIICLANNDAETALMGGIYRKVPKRYFSLYSQKGGDAPGIPEIILYPRTSRTNTTTLDSTSLGTIIQTIPELSFIPYRILEHRSEHVLGKLIDTGITQKPMQKLIGFEDELFIDKTTGFYISKRFYKGDSSRLIKDRSTLSKSETTFSIKKNIRNLLSKEPDGKQIDNYYLYYVMTSNGKPIWMEYDETELEMKEYSSKKFEDISDSKRPFFPRDEDGIGFATTSAFAIANSVLKKYDSSKEHVIVSDKDSYTIEPYGVLHPIGTSWVLNPEFINELTKSPYKITSELFSNEDDDEDEYSQYFQVLGPNIYLHFFKTEKEGRDFIDFFSTPATGGRKKHTTRRLFRQRL